MLKERMRGLHASLRSYRLAAKVCKRRHHSLSVPAKPWKHSLLPTKQHIRKRWQAQRQSSMLPSARCTHNRQSFSSMKTPCTLSTSALTTGGQQLKVSRANCRASAQPALMAEGKTYCVFKFYAGLLPPAQSIHRSRSDQDCCNVANRVHQVHCRPLLCHQSP